MMRFTHSGIAIALRLAQSPTTFARNHYRHKPQFLFQHLRIQPETEHADFIFIVLPHITLAGESDAERFLSRVRLCSVLETSWITPCP